MNQISIVQQDSKTMTSMEIAELTGKAHAHVRRDILNMFDSLKKDASIFGYIYFDKYSREQSGYELPYDETICLLTGYDANARMAVIKRWRELEAAAPAKIATPAAKPSAISQSKEFRALFGIARLIGCDKNAAAISANQGTVKLTGTNMLALLGQTHLEAENQDALYFTPTELGKRVGLSAQKINTALIDAGFRVQHGETFDVTAAGKSFARIYDTGKKHDSGVPVQQIKWSAAVIDMLRIGGQSIIGGM